MRDPTEDEGVPTSPLSQNLLREASSDSESVTDVGILDTNQMGESDDLADKRQQMQLRRTKGTEPPLPTAMPASAFELLKQCAEEVGIEWANVLERAGISRQTAWQATKGRAGIATYRRIEKEIEDSARRRGVSTTLLDLTREWSQAGVELAALDRKAFEEILVNVRAVLTGAQAMAALRNPLPPR